MHIQKSGITKGETITALEAELKAAGGTIPPARLGSKTARIEELEKLIATTKAARTTAAVHEAKMRARAAEKREATEPTPEADIIAKFKAIEDPGEKSEFYQTHRREILTAAMGG